MKKITTLILIVFTMTASAQDFWTECTPFDVTTGFYANTISIVDENVVWVSGTDYDDTGNFTATKWALSTDGGLNWTNGNIPVNAALFPCNITAVSETTAYVLFYPTTNFIRGGIWVTFDSGATWTQQQPTVFASGDPFPDSIYFFDANNGVAIGDPSGGYFEIYMTDNGGTNWIRTPSSNIPTPIPGEYAEIGQFAVMDDTIWFGTNKDNLFRSTNRGLTWTSTQMPANLPSLYAYDGIPRTPFAFQNQNDGVMTHRDGSFYTTADGGMSWFDATFDFSGTLWNRSAYRVPQTNNTYFSLGTEPGDPFSLGSSYSTDGGDNWNNLDTIDNPIMPLTAQFFSSSVGYCTAYDPDAPTLPGNLRFFRLTDTLNRLLKTDDFTAAVFTATPNPTNGMVKISGVEISSVAISDLSGKIIDTKKFAAIADAEIDLSALQSGVYFAKVSSDSGASSTLKIIKN